MTGREISTQTADIEVPELQELEIQIARFVLNSVDEIINENKENFEEGEASVDQIIEQNSVTEQEHDNSPNQVVETFIQPVYAAPFNPYTAKWEISNPIVLSNFTWNENYIQGIKLDIGFYKIKYSFGVTNEWGCGLALFDQTTKKINNLILWNHFMRGYVSTEFNEGSKYVNIESPSILAITDNKYTIKPKDVWGKYVVSIYRLKNDLP